PARQRPVRRLRYPREGNGRERLPAQAVSDRCWHRGGQGRTIRPEKHRAAHQAAYRPERTAAPEARREGRVQRRHPMEIVRGGGQGQRPLRPVGTIAAGAGALSATYHPEQGGGALGKTGRASTI